MTVEKKPEAKLDAYHVKPNQHSISGLSSGTYRFVETLRIPASPPCRKISRPITPTSSDRSWAPG
jgi:hypothetical protein